MDPFARKMICGGLAFGSAMLLMAGVLSMIYFHNRPQCSEAVLSEAASEVVLSEKASPDQRWMAAVMERRCGEESPFFVHVNLRRAAEPIRLNYFSGRAGEGEVFVVEEEAPGVAPTLHWNSPSQLTIECSRCRAAAAQKREERLGAITIRYQLQQP